MWLLRQVYLRFPNTLPCYREDGCYQTKELAEYFDREARDITDRFDKREGNHTYFEEYKDHMKAAKLWNNE